MMNGMDMMLKSLGIDPEKIKLEIASTANNLRLMLIRLHEEIAVLQKQQTAMHEQNNLILERLAQLCSMNPKVVSEEPDMANILSPIQLVRQPPNLPQDRPVEPQPQPVAQH